MRNIILLLLLSTLLSCGSSETKIEDVVSDTTRTPIEKEVVYPDSIQNKVIGEIKFGMPEKDAKKAIEKFEKQSERIIDKNDGFAKNFIGNFGYITIYPQFHNKKLYQIMIRGNFIKWEDYKTKLPEELSNIKTVLQNSLGDPMKINSIPDFSETERGKSYLVYGWLLGNKKVTVYIESENSDYYISVYISRTDIESIVEEDNQRTKDSIANAAKKVF